MTTENRLKSLVSRNKNGEAVALPSVCSAHADVIRASLRLAREMNSALIIEATSNQVNQFGGYTGMTAQDFIAYACDIARSVDYPVEAIIFGGDHLGPQAWKTEPAEAAMGKAHDMIASYVKAGFTKIHLDCSEGCLGEPAQVSDEVAGARAAQLAETAERHAPDPAKLSYIVGTEVPPPGGARNDHTETIAPTPPEEAATTLDVQARAFRDAGQQHAWDKVIGLVVQPGLEFAGDHIDHYDSTQPDRLSLVLDAYPDIAFEAHSTDYQHAAVYAELAKRHFPILKVGPALTFAYREAIYALSHIDVWLNGGEHIATVMERAMLANPKYWQNHYQGDPRELVILRHTGYADRIRYYWPQVGKEVAALRGRLSQKTIPETLLRQYFSAEILEKSAHINDEQVTSLIEATIQAALAPYFIGRVAL